jgi:hypothetical protein
MIKWTLIGDGLRVGAELRPEGWSVRRIYRLDMSGDPSEELAAWTVIDFEAENDAEADALSQALAAALAAGGGWYAGFRVGEDMSSSSPARHSAIPGRPDGRAEAVAYGRSVGVPDHQLDGPD